MDSYNEQHQQMKMVSIENANIIFNDKELP
jgi:hypothetical protein